MHLNEIKYEALKIGNGAFKGSLPEQEYQWLVGVKLMTPAKVNEMWYQLFARSDLSWSGAAHAWLTGEGIPAVGTLNERFYAYWDSLTP